MKPGSWRRRLPPPLAEIAADFGPPATPIDLSEAVSDVWPCPHCGKDNFANGQRTCSWCFLAAPWVDPADDPSYCCEAHEQLAERLRYFGGASAVGANVAKAFEARIRALDAQCPKAVAS